VTGFGSGYKPELQHAKESNCGTAKPSRRAATGAVDHLSCY